MPTLAVHFWDAICDFNSRWNFKNRVCDFFASMSYPLTASRVPCISTEVQTLAGKLISTGFANGQGTLAIFWNPTFVAVDATRCVFVTEQNNQLVRVINASTGVVQTLAGGAGGVLHGRFNGQGTNALFNNPYGIAVDASGTIFTVDRNNKAIRSINAASGGTLHICIIGFEIISCFMQSRFIRMLLIIVMIRFL